MNVLITGICGFVGATVARTLLQIDPSLRILGLDNSSRAGSWVNREALQHAGIEVIPGDIRCASDLEALPDADWVIDASANASVLAGRDGRTSGRQLVENNLFGTINLLEYCRRSGAGFILLSTSRVYAIEPLARLAMQSVDDAYVPVIPSGAAGISDAGVSEDFSTGAPVSLYGATKLASETMALEYGHTYDFPVWIDRCGVMAGAGQFGQAAQGIVAYWLHSFRERRPLKYIGFGGTGHQVRDCLHPADLARLLMLQMGQRRIDGRPQIINVSGGVASAFSLKRLTDWCARRFGPMEIATDPTMRPFDVPWMVLDASLARRTWDWAPDVGLAQVLDEVAGFADVHPDWCRMSSLR